MTRQTFYRKLREIAPNFNWDFNFLNRIRAYNQQIKICCPITAVASIVLRKEYYTHDFLEAGRHLGLSDRDILYIINAADQHFNYNTSCRKAIMKAVGLK